MPASSKQADPVVDRRVDVAQVQVPAAATEEDMQRLLDQMNQMQRSLDAITAQLAALSRAQGVEAPDVLEDDDRVMQAEMEREILGIVQDIVRGREEGGSGQGQVNKLREFLGFLDDIHAQKGEQADDSGRAGVADAVTQATIERTLLTLVQEIALEEETSQTQHNKLGDLMRLLDKMYQRRGEQITAAQQVQAAQERELSPRLRARD